MQAVEQIVARLSQHDDVAQQIEQAMAGLDINAPYTNRAQEEAGGQVIMSAGHKLSLDIVQHPCATAAAKLEGVKAMLAHGLDINARWREGRASCVVGATLLAAVLWLQGVKDDAKLELARALVDRGLQLNSESMERSTTASSGTFILAGAISTSALQPQSKADLLSMMVEAGLDLNATCQQGKDPSTTGSTLGGRIAAAPGIPATHQVSMLTTLVRGGWRPARLAKSDSTRLSQAAAILCDPSLDPAALSAFQSAIALCADEGDWTWAAKVKAGGSESR
jgi:hypothetical protein